MYGIVNNAFEDLISEQYGADQWTVIKEKSGIDIDFFLSNEPYNDDLTYQVIKAASEVLHVSVKTILIAFGEYWVLRTSKEKYGSLLAAGGASLREFLINLPMFHNRIMLIYPKLTPPEFKVTHVEEHSLHLHYFSQRAGLQEFVRGLLQGLGKMYKTPIEITLLQTRDEGSDHEIFKVGW